MSALLKLFGLNPSALVIDLIYVAIIGGVLGGVGLWVHRCHRAEADLQSINAQSKVVLAAAEARITKLIADHATEVHANEVVYERELADNSAQHASDLVRLRRLEAYRQGHPEVGNPGAGSETGADGRQSVQQGPGSFSGLGDVAASLADATRDLSVALNSCTVDRDSLTGK